MSIVSLKEIMHDAESRHYAVGCYNAIDLQMIRGVLGAAEAQRSPVILCHAEVHFKFTPLETIVPIMVHEARKARVPVAILLDHGKTYAALVQAMHLGCNAVMFDGSELSYSDNLEKTREITQVAKALGAHVEAELGHVTRPKSAGAEGDEDDSIVDDTSLYTDPAMVASFVDQSGVDALAVAFGTAHGVYLKKPKLDIERLKSIKKVSPVPLVMHGGSGLSGEDFKHSIAAGISKINYYTGMALKAANSIALNIASSKETVFYHQIMMWTIDAIKEDVKDSMRLFGSNEKA